MARNDDVQRHQNDQWQCEEDSDARDEKQFLPEGVGLSEADGHHAAVKVELVVVIGHD